MADYDRKVGKILAKLKQTGDYANSIIIVTSDHGDMDTHNRQIFKGPFMYDHLMRIPLMIRVPAHIGGKNAYIDRVLTSNVDIVPTILDLAKIPQPEQSPCDGISLASYLVSTIFTIKKPRDAIYGQYYSKQKWVNPIRTIRTHDWKFNLDLSGEEELYELRNDPEEIYNLADQIDVKELKLTLKHRLEQWINDNNDSFFQQHHTNRNGQLLD